MDDGPTIAVISANLGGFDNPQPHVKQSVPYDFHLLTDKNFLPRTNSMTPRLQARIPKMTAWQMFPDYDYYIWVDSSCRLSNKDSVKWFLEQLGDADAAFFRHNKRKTVGEEASYLKKRLAQKCTYITPRYKNERLDDQMAVIDPDGQLYATTAFVYKNDTPARDMLTIWWLHTSLYHSIDQLSLDKAIKDSGAEVNLIDEDYLKCDWIEYVR